MEDIVYKLVPARLSAGRSLRAAVVVLVAAAAALLTPVAAHADLTPAPQRPTVAGAPQAKGGMKLRGFDAAVAEANGYKIVTLPDGAKASVPAAQAEAARNGTYRPTSGLLKKGAGAESPQDWEYGEAWGDCGYSYVSFWDVGNSYAQIQTGFVITDGGAGNVWDVNWNVSIHDNGGTSGQYWDEYNGSNWGTGWTSSLRLLRLTVGYADATVVWYSSYVITTHGWLCYSNGPVAVTYIT